MLRLSRRVLVRGLFLVPLMALLAIMSHATSQAPAALHAQSSDDPALLRELAVRLLSASSADPTPRAQLYPGALPPDLSPTVPLPADSRLIGSAVLPNPFPSAGVPVVIVADTPEAPADVLSYYQSTLTAQGWSAPTNGFRPGGVTPQPSSFGGSEGNQTATVTAQTTMSVGDLEQFYAQQLISAGWTQTDGAIQGPLAWSSWTVPVTAPRWGLLTVWAGPGTDQRQLELHVISAGAASGAGATSTTIVGPPVPAPSP